MSIRLAAQASLILLAIISLAAIADEPPADLGIRAPEGFEVTLFAGDDLAHDIYSMTLDPQGRVVVAGAGYVKILHDDDSDGRADRASLFSDKPKSGAHGMVFVENDLIATGDNLLMKLEDKNADGVADGRPIPLAIVNSPEHGANGLVQGPDGWIYLIGGNDAGLGAQLARTKTSPVKKPQAGAVVRFSPDFKTSEIFAHGFRNPYDLAFNENGQLFTVDADGERDHYLPWYTPTRLFDIQQGMHHGWVQSGWTRAWARPQSYFDNVPRLVEIGRGSPTGVECYRHYAFPSEYRGNIYSCCWTLGTVYRFPLEREGSSYKSHKEIFLQTTGEVGFAPVDLAVGPNGEMYVAIGGRGTRGSVFCVRYTGKLKPEEQPPKAETELDQVLTAPQPLAAWSRAKWMPLAKKIPRDEFVKVTTDRNFPELQAIRAVEVLTEFGDDLTVRTNADLILAHGTEAGARVAWSYGRNDHERSHAIIQHWMNIGPWPYLVLERAIWETSVEPPGFGEGDPLDLRRDPADGADVAAATKGSSLWLQSYVRDRRVYHARLLRLGNITKGDRPKLGEGPTREEKFAFLKMEALAGRTSPDQLADVEKIWRQGGPAVNNLEGLIKRPKESLNAERTANLTDLMRLMQLCLGDVRVEPTKPDVYAGYVANDPQSVDHETRQIAAGSIAKRFPTESDDLNREMARTLSMLDLADEVEPSVALKLAQHASLKTSVQDDVHYLIVLSRIGGERNEEVTQKTAAALAFLHYKMMLGEMVPSRNWPLRVGEVFVELCKRDPKLADALATHREFGLPQQAMFAALMPEKERAIAARRLLEKSNTWDEDTLWTPEMVRLVAALGEADALAAVREQWHDFSLRDVILETLAAKPDAANRELFFQALALPDANSVARAATAIAALDAAGTPDEIALAMSALRQQCNAKENRAARTALVVALKVLSGEELETPEADATGETPVPLDQAMIARVYQPWFDWFAKTHPDQSKKLDAAAALDGVDLAERVAKIDWAAGDAERGAVVYNARACAKCHSGASRIGPELTGVTGRWSHEDLLREIADPNRNVAPQYHTTRLVTRDGKVYQGVLVYDSPEGTLIQTAGDTTTRIAGDEIVRTTKTTQSLMPTGLLNGLADGEIADLVAYLKTLAPTRQE